MDDHVLAGASKGLPGVCTVCHLPMNSLIRTIWLKDGHSSVNITIKHMQHVHQAVNIFLTMNRKICTNLVAC